AGGALSDGQGGRGALGAAPGAFARAVLGCAAAAFGAPLTAAQRGVPSGALARRALGCAAAACAPPLTAGKRAVPWRATAAGLRRVLHRDPCYRADGGAPGSAIDPGWFRV